MVRHTSQWSQTWTARTCEAKEQTCVFSASTQHISAGSTVDYYWEYRDIATPTSAKPTQSPNTGRSPATGAYQFTVLDPVNAPTDGSAMKLTALVENVKAGYDSGSKTGTTNTIDRQLTYYPSSGEYLFEFDTSTCATETSAIRGCFSTTPMTNLDTGLFNGKIQVLQQAPTHALLIQAVVQHQITS